MLKWLLDKRKWVYRNYYDYFIGVLLVVVIIFLVYLFHSFPKNSGWQGSFVVSATMILAIAAFAQIQSQISNQKDRQKGIYNIFIERINSWIEVIDKTREEIDGQKPPSPLTFAEAVTLAAYKRTTESGKTVTLTSESDSALERAINKVNEYLKHDYILLNILKRSEEYQILLKESGLLKPESISKLISLFDYIYLFNLEINELNNENNKQKQDLILFKSPMLKVLCIECLFSLFREANLERKNKKIIEKYKEDLKDFFNGFKGENYAYLENIRQRIKKISDEFYIKGLDK